MWSDNETEIDLLGFQHLESAVLSILLDDQLLPTTVGVYGDWGSGKSSLLRMVEKRLRAEEGTLVLWFNGWLFESFEDAKTALMGTIIDEIVSKRTLNAEVKDTVKKLGLRMLKRLQVFRLMGAGVRAVSAYSIAGKVGAVTSLTADGAAFLTDFAKQSEEDVSKIEAMAAEDVEKELKGDAGQSLRRGIREFRNDFENLLKETQIKRLVVLIDDLDRCMPDTIIETLEAIKLFLFVPHTAFVIGADERLVQYAVRRRFPELPGDRADVGQDYLEKLIQFAVRVPPLGRTEMETYINLLFASKATLKEGQFDQIRTSGVNWDGGSLTGVRFNHSVAARVLGTVPNDLSEGLAISQRIAPVLAAQLTGNPRLCKRFLNLLLLRVHMAESRGITLKKTVLAKLMLLERFKNASFRKLADAQALEDGKPKEIADAEEAVATKPENDSKPGSKTTNTRRKKIVEDGGVVDWLDDEWIKGEWLRQTPLLADEDLRPYFFFSRDKLGPLAVAVQRLSERAQEVVASLLDESDAIRQRALERAVEISPADAAAVNQALAERMRQEEDWSAENSALAMICHWAEVRPDVVSQVLIDLGSLPTDDLPLLLPQNVSGFAKGGAHDAAAKRIVTRWSQESKPGNFQQESTKQLKHWP